MCCQLTSLTLLPPCQWLCLLQHTAAISIDLGTWGLPVIPHNPLLPVLLKVRGQLDFVSCDEYRSLVVSWLTQVYGSTIMLQTQNLSIFFIHIIVFSIIAIHSIATCSSIFHYMLFQPQNDRQLWAVFTNHAMFSPNTVSIFPYTHY